MRVVIAMDSFKGSLSSIEAGKAVAEGVRRADGTIECVVCPVADGGEGTSAALTEGLHGETVRVRVTGPLGEKVTAEYGVKGDLAILEMAQAAGLPLVPQDKRNPMKTNTYGVGEMLRDAINRGCKRRVGVDEHDLDAIRFQSTARLSAGVVKFRRLTDDDRSFTRSAPHSVHRAAPCGYRRVPA